MKKLLILQGIPGSGKSYWTKEFLKANSTEWVRVNRDDIRCMLGEYWLPKREALVTEIEIQSVKSAFEQGYSVILDSTNLNQKYLKNWLPLCNRYDVGIDYKMFDIDLETAIERDKNRSRSVGEEVIKNFYNKYIKK
ncbi:MAG: AAA family ATPase [Candidatus Omnitrophica bacterium]|jgi:predicted kinase|nr:AAA family ATPase [Candidatus Omnitrophota bacterium]